MRNLLLASLLATCLPAQQALLRQQGNLIAVPVAGIGLRAALETLVAGPTPAQLATGISTAVPTGTHLLGVDVRGRTATLTLGRALAKAPQLEDAIEQITKTALRAAPLNTVHILLRTADGVRNLDEIARARAATATPPSTRPPPPPPANPVPGALASRTIAVSPGHGYYWHSTLGWTTQRGNIGGLTEDFHTNEIAMRYLIPALENLGARVISVRERGEILEERIVDNDQGAPAYTETGGWTTSGSAGWSGGTYRFASTAAATTATATWSFTLPRSDAYPVYVFYRGSSNRTSTAHYLIHHSGGIDDVVVDQTTDDRRWVHLGDWWFDQTAGARVVLENRSSGAGVVIADAVRVGAGLGSIPRGSATGGAATSGKARWRECCRYWAEFAGAPSSVWDIPGCSDSCDDVTARPKYAEWRGADAYISLHTNAGGGTGTSSFIHDTSPTAGSAALQTAVHNQIVSDIRSLYLSSWVDRGRKTANFGEVRALSTMPGVLVELAFHDTPGSVDHDALHDPDFRSIGGRAYARGVLRYFSPQAAFPPDAPVELWVTQDGNRGLRVSWSTAPGANGYSIEQSPDGKGFTEVAQTTQLTWTTGPLAHGSMRSFRVRAFNGSGRSFPTEALTAGTTHTRASDLLLVQGFDRLGEFVKGPENTQDYLRLHGDAIRRNAEFSLGFDAANNEAVGGGQVRLPGYRAVDWLLGEESTADETFSSAEQGLVRSYLQGGGRLLVTGAEVGWDLDARGSAADRAFYRQVIGAAYVRDDAGTYAFRSTNGIFAGLAAGTFDNGTQGTYNVDWPDVIRAADNKSRVDLLYASGEGAGIERIDGTARVVHLGFPLETIVDADLRAAVMARALRFLLSPRPLEASASVPLGSSLALQLALPGEPGAAYVLAASLGLGTLPLPVGQIVPLRADPVLSLSLSAGPPLFVGFQGQLSAAGGANANFAVPALAALRGLDFYFSGVTASTPGLVRSVLPWVRARVR